MCKLIFDMKYYCKKVNPTYIFDCSLQFENIIVSNYRQAVNTRSSNLDYLNKLVGLYQSERKKVHHFKMNQFFRKYQSIWISVSAAN